MRYHNRLADFFGGRATIRGTADALLRVDDHYPPLAPLVTSPIFGLHDSDPRIPTFLLSQAALALLLAATYGLGKRFASEETGVLAAMAVAAFPLVSSQSRTFMLDLPDAAMTALSLLALWRCDRFRRPGSSLLFGVAFGLALLTKWTVVFFVAAPLAFELFQTFRQPDRRVRLRNAGSAIVVASALALPWYLAHLWNLVRDSSKFSYDVGVREGDPPVASARSLLFYASSLPAATLLPWTLLFAAGVADRARDRFRKGAMLFLSIAAGWVILTLIRNKDSRYVIPLLPSVAIVGASVLERIRFSFRAKAALVISLAAISLWLTWKREPPVREEWPVREAVAFLRTQSIARPRLRVVPDWPYFERHAFEYEAEAARFPLDVGLWFRFPTFTDFVLTKTGPQGERSEPASIMRAVDDPRGDFRLLFKPVWEHALPDGSVSRIFARDVTPSEASPEEIVRALRSAAIDLADRYFGQMEDARVEVDPDSGNEIRSGRFRRVRVRIARAVIRGRRPGSPSLPVENVRLEARDLAVNPYRLLREGKLEVLSLGEVLPSVEVSEKDASDYLRAALRDESGRLTFSRGEISIQARPGRSSPVVALTLMPRIVAGENIAFSISRFRFGGFPLPARLAEALAAGNNPILKPMPCRVRLDRLRIEDGLLALND